MPKKIPSEWSAFVQQRMPSRSDERYYNRARVWMNGGGLPAKAAKIREAAHILRCAPAEIIALLFPGQLDPEGVELAAKRASRDRANAQSRKRWRDDPDCPARRRSASPEHKAYMSQYGRHHTMFQGDREAFLAHQRATLDAHRAKAVAAQGKTMRTPQARALAVVRRARNSLRSINQSIDRINRELARSAKRYSKPWHAAGFPSLRKWAAATPEGAEHLRLWWQTKSHARDARVSGLPGAITTAGWHAIMREHDYRCAYCGRERVEFRDTATRSDLEIDHVYPIGHPWARNDASNIVPSCKACNSSKSDGDLIAWAQRVGSFVHPFAMRKYWAIHANNTQESLCQA